MILGLILYVRVCLQCDFFNYFVTNNNTVVFALSIYGMFIFVNEIMLQIRLLNYIMNIYFHRTRTKLMDPHLLNTALPSLLKDADNADLPICRFRLYRTFFGY